MRLTSPRLRREASRDTALRRRCRLKSNCASVWGSPVSRAIALPGVPPAAQIALEGAHVALAARPRLVPVRAPELMLRVRAAQHAQALLRAVEPVLVRQEGRQHSPHVTLLVKRALV